MKIISRQTIIFFLPINMDAISDGQNPYTASKSDDPYWDKRQMYINPQSISIRDSKLVQKTLTKGGFVVQYWGEDLPVIEVQGTTGSSGVAGINVLKDIYRHEQIQYRTVLAERQKAMAQAAIEAAEEAATSINTGSSFGDIATLGADILTGGAFSQAVSGVSNAIDIITDPFNGGTSFGDRFGGSGTFRSIPTLATFATNIDMYHQGEFFRGYFSNFNVTETATEPGHFSYTFSFNVTRRTGSRENFMPWHREPVSPDGQTIMSQKTSESKGTFPGTRTLSFKGNPGQIHGDWDKMPIDPDNRVGYDGHTSSKYNDTDDSSEDKNSVPTNRRGQVTKGNS